MTELERQRLLLRQCSIAAALETVGERWSLLILRASFNGLQHFEEYQATLGIARNILANRLARLVAHGILERVPDRADRRKITYRLTPKGRDLLPVLLSLRQWGDRWVSGRPSNPVLVDRTSKRPVAPIRVRSAEGRALSISEVEWLDRAELPNPIPNPAR